jgi:hypothetical protein
VSINASIIEAKGDHPQSSHPGIKRKEISKPQPGYNKKEHGKETIINNQEVFDILTTRLNLYWYAAN